MIIHMYVLFEIEGNAIVHSEHLLHLSIGHVHRIRDRTHQTLIRHSLDRRSSDTHYIDTHQTLPICADLSERTSSTDMPPRARAIFLLTLSPRICWMVLNIRRSCVACLKEGSWYEKNFANHADSGGDGSRGQRDIGGIVPTVVEQYTTTYSISQ